MRLINTFKLVKLLDKLSAELKPRFVVEDVRDEDIHGILMGFCISNALPLPSSRVENANEWFMLHCLQPTVDMLAELSNHTPIDVPKVQRLVHEMWATRYDILHNVLSPVSFEFITRGAWSKYDKGDPWGGKMGEIIYESNDIARSLGSIRAHIDTGA